MGILNKLIGYLSKKDETELAKARIGARAYGLVDEYLSGTPKGPRNKSAAERYVLDQLLSDNGQSIYGRVPSAKEFGRISLDGIVSDAVSTYQESVSKKTRAPAKARTVPVKTAPEAKDKKAWSPADDAPYRDLTAYFDRKAGRKSDAKEDHTLVIWAKNAGIPVIGDERLVFVDNVLQDYRNQTSH